MSAPEIDAKGMAACRRLVFSRALDDLVDRSGVVTAHNTVDGTIFTPWRDVPYACVPKADATVPAVSAASIVAKVTRDAHILGEVAEAMPVATALYDWVQNKGYPTAKHVEAIRVHGRTPLHRHSFRLQHERIK